MARAPQTTQRQAPAPLESPAVRRSRYLSELLQQTRQAPQIQSGGELGARLLAQGLAQFGANRAEGAVQREQEARTAQQLGALNTAIGEPATGLANALVPSVAAPDTPGNMVTPQQAATAPIAPIEAAPLPPAQPAQPAIPSPLLAQIRLLRDQGDIDGATELFGQYQQQQARVANLPPELRDDPLYAWAAVNNPEALAESLGMRARPVTAAEGTNVITGGPRGDTVYNPRTFVAGGDVLQTRAGGGVEDVYDVAPTPADVVAQGRLALDERTAGYTLSPAQVRVDIAGNEVARGAPDPAQVAREQDRVEREQGAADTAIARSARIRGALEQARPLISSLSAGRASGIIPLNQWRTNLEKALEPVLASLSFAELQQMRTDSPTGGALGGIAVRELELLGATIASLSVDQSPEQLNGAIDAIDRHVSTIEAVTRVSRNMPVSPELVRLLPPGTEFIGTDGVRRRRQ